MPRIAIAPSQCSVISWNCRHSRPAGCSILYDLTSGMLPRPLMIRISRSSSCSLTELAVGLTGVSGPRCCAPAGGAGTTHARRKPKRRTERRRAEAPAANRMRERNFVMFVPSCAQGYSPPSWPGLSRPSTPCLPKPGKKGVDARDKRGHDAEEVARSSERALRLDGLAVGGHPSPRPRPVAARCDALLVDVGHLVAVAGKQ